MGTSEHAPAKHFMRVHARPARSIFSKVAVATSTIRREGLGEDMVSLIQDP
jgi:hypothetical protein